MLFQGLWLSFRNNSIRKATEIIGLGLGLEVDAKRVC